MRHNFSQLQGTNEFLSEQRTLNTIPRCVTTALRTPRNGVRFVNFNPTSPARELVHGRHASRQYVPSAGVVPAECNVPCRAMLRKL
jgi:hypothetical protein